MNNEHFIGSCDSCGFKDILVKNFNTTKFGQEGKEIRTNNFCDLCSHTLISGHVSYPAQYPNWIGALGYIGNAILQEIRSLKNERLSG